jgi:hypothetical protein
MTGTVYTVPPIPPDAEHTTWVDAGVLRIGVEWRNLDEAELEANYEGEAMEEVQAAITGNIQDNGVSLHIAGVDDAHEYLRFDMFEQEPHYHYIERSGERQTIIEFDRVALGEMLPWALHQLRTRLPEMLAYAGGEDLVAKLDRKLIASSLAEVERLAREAQKELARGR